MNHNILNKIIDQVALNQWQQKINQVNQEYHQYFEMTICDPQRGPHLALKNNFCIPSFVMFYNWRDRRAPFIYNHNICYCFKCQEKHPRNNESYSVAYIPINY